MTNDVIIVPTVDIACIDHIGLSDSVMDPTRPMVQTINNLMLITFQSGRQVEAYDVSCVMDGDTTIKNITSDSERGKS